MNFSISEYWHILTTFTNPFSIVISCLKFAGMAFLFFLLLVIFLRKFILVKRKYLFFKILGWTYIFLIPILAAFFGFKWGLIDGVRNDLNTHMSAYTSGLDKILNDELGISSMEFVNEITNGKDSSNLNLNADQAIDKFSEIIYAKVGTTIENELVGKGGTENEITAIFLHITKSALLSATLKESIRKLLNDELGMDEDGSKELMTKKFNDLLNRGLFTAILQLQVDRFFRGMEKSLYFLFGLILIFPITEIMIANIIYRRKMRTGTVVR